MNIGCDLRSDCVNRIGGIRSDYIIMKYILLHSNSVQTRRMESLLQISHSKWSVRIGMRLLQFHIYTQLVTANLVEQFASCKEDYRQHQ